MRCPHCPATAPCPGHHLCKLTDPTHAAYDDRYVKLLSSWDQTSGEWVETNDTQWISKIAFCDFRHSDCHCLTKPAVCLQAGYPAIVNFHDCKRCLSGE